MDDEDEMDDDEESLDEEEEKKIMEKLEKARAEGTKDEDFEDEDEESDSDYEFQAGDLNLYESALDEADELIFVKETLDTIH